MCSHNSSYIHLDNEGPSMKILCYALIAIWLVSCREPEPLDLRGELVGQYSYWLRYYNVDLTPRPNAGWQDIKALLEFEKTEKPDAFDIVITSTNDRVHCHSLARSSNGYTFTILNSSFFDSQVSISGFAHLEMDGARHHGIITPAEGRIHCFIRSASARDTLIIELDATRE